MHGEWHIIDVHVESAKISIIISKHKPKKIAVFGKAVEHHLNLHCCAGSVHLLPNDRSVFSIYENGQTEIQKRHKMQELQKHDKMHTKLQHDVTVIRCYSSQ